MQGDHRKSPDKPKFARRHREARQQRLLTEQEPIIEQKPVPGIMSIMLEAGEP
jgi:hypothetical protein